MKYDVVLYGATGFTGRLTAKYLDRAPDLKGRSWAVAGRTLAKLEDLTASLSSGPGLVHCPLTDEARVAAMVGSAKVVLNCAGPFSMHHGSELMGACAKAGVHYSDLSGETFWQREMVQAWSASAEASGAKIVLGGGVDSIPSDLGAYLALAALRPAAGDDVSVATTWTAFSGSLSGGTLESGRARARALKSGRTNDAVEADPYALAPGASGPDQTPDGLPPGSSGAWSGRFGRTTPFFMAPINARVVRRSLALRGLASTTSYAECASVAMWARLVGLLASRGFGYFVGGPVNFKPRSGEGPPPWLIEAGAFKAEVAATSSSGSARATVSGRGDPGYGATAKMLAELGLCLAFDTPTGEAGPRAGVLTPSTALGDALVARLNAAEGGSFMSLTAE